MTIQSLFQACINLIIKEEKVVEGAEWEKLKKERPSLTTEVLDEVTAVLRRELAEEKRMRGLTEKALQDEQKSKKLRLKPRALLLPAQ